MFVIIVVQGLQKHFSSSYQHVIGVVDNVEEKPSSKNVVFDLKDLSGVSICCTLWDSYCLRLVSYWRESRDTPYPAIILTQAKIKAASGFIVFGDDGEEDPKCFPQDLDVLLGCTLAFKVKPQGNNRPASVMRVSTDREIIGHISSLLGQTEVMEIVEAKENCSDQSELRKGKSIVMEIVEAKENCSDELEVHKDKSIAMELPECGDNAACDLFADTDSSLMCLSRTADLDPDVVLCVTPRKDLCTTSNNEDIEYIPSNFMEFDLLEDLPLAQLSATKTMKTIKNEK
ncbi:Nucleic acid-binding [Vigna unguiculata]|uniref:Nucleic acid-binding n=1 Tax=Vigna unguiculata TaxID=3917 RepID=A0A4D6L5L4_VIGUN|nr:Nucleic acid-binding [Vigna unguiculata]